MPELPVDALVDAALHIAAKESDAAAMAELRANFDALASNGLAGRKRMIEPTRPNLIALLQALANGLRPAMELPLGLMPDARPIVTDHPAVSLLMELADALADLDKGKTAPALKASSYAANRSIPAREMRERKALLDAVLIIERVQNCKSRRDAECILAANMRAKGKTVGGKPVTVQMLKSWRDRTHD